MSNEKANPLAAMLAQYEAKNKPAYEKKSEKVYDLKNYFNTFIKEGVKTATKTIRIIPNADGTSPFTEVHGHKIQVDGEWKTFACLKEEKGEPCPFCEARDVLNATGTEANKELAKKYKAKLMYVVKVIDRDAEEDGVKFWRFNHDWRKEGIMDKFQSLIGAIKKDVTDIETGRDLVLTINRNQNNIPVVSGMASLDPSPLSEDATKVAEWTSDARTWEDVYSVKSYDYLEIIVKGGIPVWDKEAKKFVDKAAVKAEGGDGLEAELVMGVENVKNGITPATAPAATATETTTTNVAEEGDDLPF
jgi:hypothetical protein